MSVAEGPIRLARFKDDFRQLLRRGSAFHDFLLDTPVFRVQAIARPAWMIGSYQIIDEDLGTLHRDYLEFIELGLYVFTTDGKTSYLPMQDMLRAISDLPEGTKWSFMDPSNPTEEVLSPT